MIILQNKKSGEIKNVKTGFDWSTFILSFLALGWLPSLFRKDILGFITILIIQIMPFILLSLYFVEKSQVTEILLLASLNIAFYYTIFKCVVNLKRYVKILKMKGFEPVLLNK